MLTGGTWLPLLPQNLADHPPRVGHRRMVETALTALFHGRLETMSYAVSPLVKSLLSAQ